MNAKRLKELIDIFEGSSLSELTLSGLFRSVTLKRGGAPAPSFAAPAAAAAPASEKPTAVEPTEVDDSELVYITAPLVGTFYSSPSPEADPYIKVGTTVSKGDIVCIVEAMKVMNEIESEHDGTVVKVLINNAQPVEYGQKLFAVKPH
ncbi:MAG: acetyl-CoA carboxylase biotin carboxyl carrier protein [Candidatus Coatesbacteria bacterium]|nr:acetyl-CoA carboxylase biotin carboxyl carrier protein [Candidatus Coatesbacteria bacterium]